MHVFFGGESTSKEKCVGRGDLKIIPTLSYLENSAGYRGKRNNAQPTQRLVEKCVTEKIL